MSLFCFRATVHKILVVAVLNQVLISSGSQTSILELKSWTYYLDAS